MPSRKVSILVVDDDIQMLRMIRRILEFEGYQIVVLRSDEDALEVFGEGTPQALLAKENFLLCHTEAQIVTSLHDIAFCYSSLSPAPPPSQMS